MGFISKCWKLRETQCLVEWETTNFPYSVRGPREEGKFCVKGFFRAWIWGKRFCLAHSMGAVYIGPSESDGVPVGNI